MLKPSHKHSFVTIKRNSRHRNLVIWLMKSSLILHQAKVILLLKCWGFAYGFLEDKTNLMHTESMSTSGSKKLLVEVYGKIELSVQELVEQKLPVSKLLSFDENLFYLFSGDNVYK
jgi:hypothetical protein